jgi:hypothetical protein
MKINIFFIIFYLTCFSAFSQSKGHELFTKYIDSAYKLVDLYPTKASQYLDSIPQPIKDNLQGQLADYYNLRALIANRDNDRAEVYQNFLLTLKYAKQEENYDLAGNASLELFYNTYVIKKDSTAFKYLADAKNYYTKANNKNGLLEVLQMPAYVEFYNKNYDKSNALLLEHLEDYKSVEEDAYYYLYALFMMSSNHIHLENLNTSHKYFNVLKQLESHPTIPKPLYELHTVSLYTCIAEYHLDKKAMDSTLYYLKKAGKLKHAMNPSDEELYYKIYLDYYDIQKDFKSKNAYVDSLSILQQKLLNKTIDASLNITSVLENSEKQLEKEVKKKKLNKNLIYILLGLLVLVVAIFIVKFNKIKRKLSDFISSLSDYSYLKTKHEKLKVKVHGLEEFVETIKKDIKSIATINNPEEQKTRIKALYSNLYLNSSTLLDKSESHLELINELNVDFFNKISVTHPELNESEIIVCYYIYTGFKNKEIAVFLKTSTRAIESKRYRITKKLKLGSANKNLQDYLLEQF